MSYSSRMFVPLLAALSVCMVGMSCRTFALNAVAPVIAAPVILKWDRSVDPTVRGYAIYYGVTNFPATNRINVGTNLTCTLSNLLSNVGYKFFAVAYNAAGVESAPSNQLLLTPTPIAGLKIAAQAGGAMKLSCRIAPATVCGILVANTPRPAVWQTLTNVTASSLGDVIALDSSANKVPTRFYRVALSAQPLVTGLRIEKRPDRSMRLSFNAPPGAVCRVVYASTPSAVNWPVLATVTADQEGHATFNDTSAPGVSSRFYRVRIP